MPVHAPIAHDHTAAEIARAAHARAVTVGSQIYVRPADYRPDAPAGRELIAHEQLHVAQQRIGLATSETAIAAAEAEATQLAPIVAKHGWDGVRVTRPAAPVMCDAIPEQDLSEDRNAIRNTLETRFPWLWRLSNREELETALVERIVFERKIHTTQEAIAKLPDPRATILSEEIDRRVQRRAPLYKRLDREIRERDRHHVWVKIDPMQLVSPQMWADASKSSGVVAILRELKRYPAWVVLERNGLDSFRYGLSLRLDGAWLPVSNDGIQTTAFFRAGLVEPMLQIQSAYYSATSEQLSGLMRQWVDLDPSIAERELDEFVAQNDATEGEPDRPLTAEEQEIADYQAANRQYAETIRAKTEKAVQPLIFIAALFEIDGPLDLLLAVFPVEKVGKKLFSLGKEALAARRARKAEQLFLKEFVGHADEELSGFLKLARAMSKAEVRALKTISQAVKSPALIETLMRRSIKGTADLAWIAKKLEQGHIDSNFVRAFTRAESGPSWKTFADIVEKRTIAPKTRDSLASKMTGLLGEEAAQKVVKSKDFLKSALGHRADAKFSKVLREVPYGGAKSLDIVALSDKAELIVGEVKHYSGKTWLTDQKKVFAQLRQHNEGIKDLTKAMSRAPTDVKKKVLFVSADGFNELAPAMRASIAKEVGELGWTIQKIENSKIETFAELIDRVR